MWEPRCGPGSLFLQGGGRGFARGHGHLLAHPPCREITCPQVHSYWQSDLRVLSQALRYGWQAMCPAARRTSLRLRQSVAQRLFC